jgi:predicted TIM-barrel enzyme
VTAAAARTLPPGTRGVIVGTAVMRRGVAGAGIDPARAEAFVAAARGLG